MSNIGKVQQIYAAFGSGNVPAVLEHLAPGVDWEYGGVPEIPWLIPRSSREDVVGFFRVLGDMLDLTKFEITRIVEDGDLVIALANIEFTVKPTGKKIAEVDEPHLWHFDKQGRVVKFRHRTDSYRHWLAYRG